MSQSFREEGESRGSRRKALLALAALLCFSLAATFAFTGQSTAEDPLVSDPGTNGEPIAPAEALPATLTSDPALDSSDVEITVGPSGTVASSDATFAFSSSTADGFECSLDGANYVLCTSPQTYSGLQNGSHLFAVRVASTNASAPALRVWEVANVMPCTSDNEAVNFAVYSLGEVVDGLELTSTRRECEPLEPGAPVRANFVSYVYGTCPALEEGTVIACAPPLEIQSWPACERTLADYEIATGTPYPHESLGELAGVPAYSFDDGTRVELYTGESTLVIFASDPALIDEAVASLQREPVNDPPGEPTAGADGEAADLPEPDAGAISGKLSCA